MVLWFLRIAYLSVATHIHFFIGQPKHVQILTSTAMELCYYAVWTHFHHNLDTATHTVDVLFY